MEKPTEYRHPLPRQMHSENADSHLIVNDIELQARLNDLEAACNFLQKRIQILRNNKTELIATLECFQKLLDELWKNLDHPTLDKAKKYSTDNILSSMTTNPRGNIPRQNSSLLNVPEISGNVQDSVNIDLVNEYNMTVLTDMNEVWDNLETATEQVEELHTSGSSSHGTKICSPRNIQISSKDQISVYSELVSDLEVSVLTDLTDFGHFFE